MSTPLFPFPGFIEAQEAAGQREVAAKSMLPRDGGGVSGAIYTSLGISLEEGDDLFYKATLPATRISVRRRSEDGKRVLVFNFQSRKKCSIPELG